MKSRNTLQVSFAALFTWEQNSNRVKAKSLLKGLVADVERKSQGLEQQRAKRVFTSIEVFNSGQRCSSWICKQALTSRSRYVSLRKSLVKPCC